jgi:hypothetical protein
VSAGFTGKSGWSTQQGDPMAKKKQAAADDRPADADEKDELFWDLAEPLMAEGVADRSTMMGFPCLRTGGDFFASLDHRTGDLIVKLPADRVTELVESGEGQSFAPAGRTFREWVSMPEPDENRWKQLMDEARAFVSGS